MFNVYFCSVCVCVRHGVVFDRYSVGWWHWNRGIYISLHVTWFCLQVRTPYAHVRLVYTILLMFSCRMEFKNIEIMYIRISNHYSLDFELASSLSYFYHADGSLLLFCASGECICAPFTVYNRILWLKLVLLPPSSICDDYVHRAAG